MRLAVDGCAMYDYDRDGSMTEVKNEAVQT
jgi:hypothetical protein